MVPYRYASRAGHGSPNRATGTSTSGTWVHLSRNLPSVTAGTAPAGIYRQVPFFAILAGAPSNGAAALVGTFRFPLAGTDSSCWYVPAGTVTALLIRPRQFKMS